MNADAETASSSKSPALSHPHLRPARFDDYERIARLEAVLDSGASTPDDWRMFWQRNPLWPHVRQKWPIGWVLESPTREIVGSLSNIPLLYHFRGEQVIVASGRAWVVVPEYRGFALWLLDERFNQPGVDVFIDTSVGSMAFEPFNEFSNCVPAGDWETIAYFVTGYRAFVTRALRKLNAPLVPVLAAPAGAALRLKDVIFGKEFPKARSSFVIDVTDRFDSRFDAFWKDLLRQNADKLQATRDSATLSWHFSVAMRRGRLWIFTTSRNRQLRAYCIFKRQDTAQEVRRMRLVDYQTIDPDVDLLPDLLRAALRRCAAEGVSVLDKAGLGLAKMRAFDEFAPYRRKQSWSFFYRAVEPALAVALRQPQVWDPSEYDGDASIE
jgi:hypothetical protein